MPQVSSSSAAPPPPTQSNGNAFPHSHSHPHPHPPHPLPAYPSNNHRSAAGQLPSIFSAPVPSLSSSGADSNSAGTGTGTGTGPTPPSPTSSAGGHGDWPMGYGHLMSNDAIAAHLYMAGFNTGAYSDVKLHVGERIWLLHKIIISRSPLLAHLLRLSDSSDIYIPLDDPNITEEAFSIALGHLYSATFSASLINLSNARAVLASASLLGGLDDLCSQALHICRASLSLSSILEWVSFVEQPPDTAGSVSSLLGHGTTHAAGFVGAKGEPETCLSPELGAGNLLYGSYSAQLRADVLRFLVVNVPEELGVFGPDKGRAVKGEAALAELYASLPFAVFKHCLESPHFPAPNDQFRFNLAKKIIAHRRKRLSPSSPEETVVLAFGGGGSGTAVHVTRKTRRKYWKVEA